MSQPTGERVVVAGATGYLGAHVAEALHAAGYRVRGLARDARRLERIRASCDEVFCGEATRPETLRGLFDGADVAFSSIGIRHVKRRPTIWLGSRTRTVRRPQSELARYGLSNAYLPGFTVTQSSLSRPPVSPEFGLRAQNAQWEFFPTWSRNFLSHL
jgi:hypothetical protein